MIFTISGSAGDVSRRGYDMFSRIIEEVGKLVERMGYEKPFEFHYEERYRWFRRRKRDALNAEDL